MNSFIVWRSSDKFRVFEKASAAVWRTDTKRRHIRIPPWKRLFLRLDLMAEAHRKWLAEVIRLHGRSAVGYRFHYAMYVLWYSPFIGNKQVWESVSVYREKQYQDLERKLSGVFGRKTDYWRRTYARKKKRTAKAVFWYQLELSQSMGLYKIIQPINVQQ